MSINLERAAILLVDPQNDYCVENGIIASLGYSVEGRHAVAANLAQVVDRLRPSMGGVFFIRTETPSWGRSAALSSQYSRNALRRTVDDSLGDWFGVSPAEGDHVITKARYSAFQATPLDAALRALNIDTVIVGGFTTEVCVDSTVRDAFFRDYNVVVLSDCTAASTPERHEVALGVIDTFFGRVIDSDALLAELSI